jgi:hypothetical protein
VRPLMTFGWIGSGVKSVYDSANPYFQETRLAHDEFHKLAGTVSKSSCTCPLAQTNLKVGVLGLLGALVMGAVMKYGTDKFNENTLPPKEVPRVHSCATWAAEKLHNLHIDDIDNDLNPSVLVELIDKCVYVTTFHMGDKEESLQVFDRNSPLVSPAVHRAQESVEKTQSSVDNILYAPEHKATRAVIVSGTSVVASVAADIAKDVIVQSCFDR